MKQPFMNDSPYQFNSAYNGLSSLTTGTSGYMDNSAQQYPQWINTSPDMVTCASPQRLQRIDLNKKVPVFVQPDDEVKDDLCDCCGQHSLRLKKFAGQLSCIECGYVKVDRVVDFQNEHRYFGPDSDQPQNLERVGGKMSTEQTNFLGTELVLKCKTGGSKLGKRNFKKFNRVHHAAGTVDHKLYFSNFFKSIQEDLELKRIVFDKYMDLVKQFIGFRTAEIIQARKFDANQNAKKNNLEDTEELVVNEKVRANQLFNGKRVAYAIKLLQYVCKYFKITRITLDDIVQTVNAVKGKDVDSADIQEAEKNLGKVFKDMFKPTLSDFEAQIDEVARGTLGYPQPLIDDALHIAKFVKQELDSYPNRTVICVTLFILNKYMPEDCKKEHSQSDKDISKALGKSVTNLRSLAKKFNNQLEYLLPAHYLEPQEVPQTYLPINQ